MSADHVDVLILGAGISGIGAACRLSLECPGVTYRVLERRHAIGGTWDLFRYPGVRSDSDMYTFGYNFRPWYGTRVLADGASIRAYVEATAAEFGVTDQITFGRMVTTMSWSSTDHQWTVTATHAATGAVEQYTSNFLIAASGYYDYDTGYRPEFPGETSFAGTIVHPQHWPSDLDYAGKRVVVVGSGATAVTLVPAMAPDAAHVTMLQRTPSYVVALPAEDKISAVLKKVLPEAVVYRLARVRNIALQRGLYAFARSFPEPTRRLFRAGVRHFLGRDADLSAFAPAYGPWEQRLCVVPDGDLFKAIRSGQADVVTDRIDTFTENGIRLASGRELEADIVVSATGLNVRLLGGASLDVDGAPVSLKDRLTYKGVLVEGIPNAAVIFGYINASWTLKADIASEYVCRLVNHMRANSYTQAVVHADAGERTDDSVLGSLTSGYVRRGNDQLPRQGRSQPWRVGNNYLRDAPMLRHGTLEDGVLELSTTRSVRTAAAEAS